MPVPVAATSPKRRLLRIGACALAAISLITAPQSTCAQSFCQYEISAIIQGPSCGIFGYMDVRLLGLNDLGQAVGYVNPCVSIDTKPIAWSEETGLVLLPLPEGIEEGEAEDINNVLGDDGLGQIVGKVMGPATGGAEWGFFYDDGEWTLLPPDDGGVHSTAFAINDAGQACGYRGIAGATTTFRWEKGRFTHLNRSNGAYSIGRDINEGGVACGELETDSGEVGFLWERVAVIEIAGLPGATTSGATTINDAKTAAGFSVLPVERKSLALRAWLYADRTVTQLPHPPGFDHSSAGAINDAGQVIMGASSFFEGGPTYVWQLGSLIRIDELVVPVPGVPVGHFARAINNRGQIITSSGFDGAAVGLILSPMDVPLGDVNLNCTVDEHDLIAVLEDWGPCPPNSACICDIVTSATFQPPSDGVVDGADLAVVLGNWTVATKAPAANRMR